MRRFMRPTRVLGHRRRDWRVRALDRRDISENVLAQAGIKLAARDGEPESSHSRLRA